MGDLDRAKIEELHAGELARFRQERPRSLAMIGRARAHMPNGVPMAWMASDNDQPVYIDHGLGPGFTDIDGFGYVDFNASDMAMFCGHANPAIIAAVQAQVARSTQFLLPTPASVEVAEELARRYPVPQWQFTLSATQANTEAIRLARAVTGREVVVLFQGHYHGHFEEGLVDLADGRAVPVQRGRPRHPRRRDPLRQRLRRTARPAPLTSPPAGGAGADAGTLAARVSSRPRR